ncbi:LOW QUALITY PROTEIN: hypothetical protein OSB04_029114 [Centaurea solstitialis]|uniref:CCHC-type domain-containing protein n=1 Tax=Centaurea solstitialis TaxID=347529 RepID=A0AA38SHT3_9ASTR|nr:LOW QUALITY PROTEIN: hypothetical protein OSB04_029114 [Centaurea solstitialis]
MAKGTSVSDHVMKMKRHIDHLERLGHPLATDTQLNSLSEDYKQFVINYNMNNMEKTIAELHSMLKTAELSMGTGTKTKDVLMMVGAKRKRGYGNTSKGKSQPPASQSVTKVENNDEHKGKGKKVKPNKARTENRCFRCHEIGHWRQNCPKRHKAGINTSVYKFLTPNVVRSEEPRIARIYVEIIHLHSKLGKLQFDFTYSGYPGVVPVSPGSGNMEMFYHLPDYKSAYNLVSLSACLGASLGPCHQSGIANLHKWESILWHDPPFTSLSACNGDYTSSHYTLIELLTQCIKPHDTSMTLLLEMPLTTRIVASGCGHGDLVEYPISPGFNSMRT